MVFSQTARAEARRRIFPAILSFRARSLLRSLWFIPFKAPNKHHHPMGNPFPCPRKHLSCIFLPVFQARCVW